MQKPMISSSFLNSVSEIPILAYHKVSPHAEFGLTTVKPQRFRDHIDYLYQKEYMTVTFHDLMQPNFVMPAKPIIITFDDAYRCIYEYAMPILAKYAFRSVIFVVSGFIGQANSWEAFGIQRGYRHLSHTELIELHRHGHEIGSHTVTHPYLPVLTTSQANSELGDSKSRLEDTLGQTVISFCYPYGKSSPRLEQLLIQNEYKFATINKGVLPDTKNNPLRLMRSCIYATDTLNQFTVKIAKFDRVNLIEWAIQRGAYTGILKKSMQHILSNSEDFF